MYRWRGSSISKWSVACFFPKRGRHGSVDGGCLVDALLRRGRARLRRRLKLSANLLHVVGMKVPLISHPPIPILKQRCKANVWWANGRIRVEEGGSLEVGSHPYRD